MILFQLLVYKHPILILISALFQNVFNGLFYISVIMVSDVLDYQQWKTGKRLEGFWQNYHSFIITLAGIFTAMLLPLFLSFAGVGFSDNISLALKKPLLRDNIYKYQTLLSLIGAVVGIAPMFFYDLTEKKHANYVRVLKIRAGVDNYNDGELLDKDVLNVKEVVDYANDNNDAFLLEELSKHNCIECILEKYNEVFDRVDAKRKEDEDEELARNKDLEEKKLIAKKNKAKAKADKNGLVFDENLFESNFRANSRYLKEDTQKVEVELPQEKENL